MDDFADRPTIACHIKSYYIPYTREVDIIVVIVAIVVIVVITVIASELLRQLNNV